MATAFFDHTASLLDDHISKLGTAEFVEISDEKSIWDACLQVLTEGFGMVKNQDDFPLGILNGELAVKLLGHEGALSQYRDRLIPIALSPPDTPMGTILHLLLEIGSIPWFVLMTDNKCVGIVPSISIAQGFSRYFRPRAEVSRVFWNHLWQLKTDITGSIIDDRIPNRPEGPPNCYCCPDLLNSQRPHRLQRFQLKNRDNRGNLVCPDHPNQRVMASAGCTAC